MAPAARRRAPSSPWRTGRMTARRSGEAAAREFSKGFFEATRPGKGEWLASARPPLPAPQHRLDSDRIVPAATAPAAGSGWKSRRAMSAWSSAAGPGNGLGAACRLAFPPCRRDARARQQPVREPFS
jgi:hypothetical protein